MIITYFTNAYEGPSTFCGKQTSDCSFTSVSDTQLIEHSNTETDGNIVNLFIIKPTTLKNDS